MTSKHGPLNGGTFEPSQNSQNQQNPNHSTTMANKYHSIDARYHSIKNLPPDLRSKLREALRQKRDNNEPNVNNYLGNNSDIPPFPAYKSPPYNPNQSQNEVGKMTKGSEILNPYKQLPYNDAFYQVRALSKII